MSNTLNILVVFVCLLLSACNSNEKLNILTGSTMGTTYTIKTVGKKISQIQIDKRLAEINKIFSTWDLQSELSLLNKKPINQWILLSDELFFVISASIEIYQQTDGYFDPGIGRLLDLWGFGAVAVSAKPKINEVEKMLSLVSIKYIQLKNKKIKKLRDIHINLSAIAKGYAVDEIAKLLKSKNIDNFLVEIGGEVITLGKNLDKKWVIGIESPQGKAPIAVTLDSKAIATSGGYRNYFVWQQKKYMHILNPMTGLPATSDLASVSVIHKKAITADAYATAMIAMGSNKAVKLAKKLGLAVIFILDEQHNFKLVKINL